MKKSKDKKVIKKSGITLISLVITIIVILILAGVTIATLTGDNGLLQKAQTAKETNDEAEILEKIKIAYADYQIGQYKNTFKDALEKIFDKDEIKSVSEKKEKYIVEFNNTAKMYYYDTSSGKADEYVYVDPFNYGSKTKETIVQGDDITLGTEKFKVFSVSDTEIKAIPYYNLKFSNPIKQVTAETVADAGTSSFSTTNYWKQEDEEIDMGDLRNNIQTYIESYKTTLDKLGAGEINVRVARLGELSDSGVTNEMRNPSKQGSFWIGSAYADFALGAWYVGGDGNNYCSYYSSSFGVRPIIIIEK